MEREGKESLGGRIAKGAIVLVLKTIAWAIVIAVPLLGVWAGSSLAVYWDQPIGAALVAGLCAFPLLPLAWEGVSALRRSRREKPPARVLTFADRLIVRTFVLNFVFLAAFLALWPVPIFEALASRGDWMLQGRTDERSESIRAGLLALADGMSWLYEAAKEDNPYEDEAPAVLPTPQPTPQPTPEPTRPSRPDPAPTPTHEAIHEDAHARVARLRGSAPPRWPLPDDLHPLVRALPSDRETSIESVARYIAENEHDPYLRVKALHDYVADRIAYDAPVLSQPQSSWPSQDAETVFASRRGVCAGYAHLMVALGEVTGDHIVYVVGDSRDEDDGISGVGHAWNAVEIEGRWYLMDATWDAGSVEGDRFTKQYDSDYFLTPPEMFSLDHLPEDPAWQLREDPVTRGEFVRQPRLKPGFFRAGFRLVTPDRSHVTARGAFVARIDNPASHFALARIRPHRSSSQGERCDVTGGRTIEVRCRIPADGLWDVLVFESAERYATYWDVASFQVAGGP